MEISPQVERELQAAAAACGCELVHAEFQAGVLRIFVDREGGVTLDDCAAVSRQASAHLDVIDFGGGRYTLEVSSPGLDRQLYRPADWSRFRGRRVRVSFLDPVTHRKRTLVAVLEGYDEATRRVRLLSPEADEVIEVALEAVVKAKLEVDW